MRKIRHLSGATIAGVAVPVLATGVWAWARAELTGMHLFLGRSLALSVATLAAAVVLGARASRSPKGRRWALWCYTGALASWAGANMWWTATALHGGVTAASLMPQGPDGLFVVSAVLLFLGLLGTSVRLPQPTRLVVVDTVLGISCSVVVVWLVSSWLYRLKPDLWVDYTGAAFATLKAVALLLACLLFVLALRRRRWQAVLLAAAAGAISSSSFGFTMTVAAGTYRPGSLVELGWLGGAVLVVIAAYVPASAAPPVSPSRVAKVLSWVAAPAVGAAALLPSGPGLGSPVTRLGIVMVVATLAARSYVAQAKLMLATQDLEARVAERTAQIESQSSEIARLAYHDPVTGILNRNAFQERLAQTLESRRARPGPIGVAFFDLDRFKQVNDTLGHAQGDGLLQAVAQALLGAVRGGDTVARMGGDEFAILYSAVTSIDDVLAITRRALGAIRQVTIDLGGAAQQVRASAGLTVAPTGRTADALALLREADIAMYNAKAGGGDAVVVYGADVAARWERRAELEAGLRLAAERGDLELYYQPIVDMSTVKTVSVEALLRWQRQDEGIVMPGEIIPVIEEAGLIRPIGEWAIRTAVAAAARWAGAGAQPIGVAVNISASQLTPELPTAVTGALVASGLPAELLTLELTESGLLDASPATLAILSGLRATGVKVALDDFGTGYSSLARLAQLPIDTLKIDRSFAVRDDERTKMVVTSIIGLAHELGLGVVVEGIETEAQRDRFVRLGGTFAQGWLFGVPVAEREITETVWHQHYEARAAEGPPVPLRMPLVTQPVQLAEFSARPR